METVRALNILQFLLVSFNLAFWLSGLMFLFAGLWMDITLMKYSETCAAFSKLSVLLLIFTGVMILCLGSLGCCCTLKTEPSLFYWYHGLMTVIFIMEIAVVITVFSCKGCLARTHVNDFEEMSKKLPNLAILTEHFDDVDTSQSLYNCCGLNNYEDWRKLNPPMTIPESCCQINGCNTQNKTEIFQEGCYHKVHNLMATNMTFIGVIGLLVATLPIIGHMITKYYRYVLERSSYQRI